MIVRGVGINGLHRTPLGQDAIVQLASQFNYLESPGPYQVPVSRYNDDHTQGPLGAIEAAASTLHRHAAVTSGRLPHALIGSIPTLSDHHYQHGYLMLSNMAPVELKNLYQHLKAHINQMAILPQWVMCESSGAYQLQVFGSAPSFQGQSSPPKESYKTKIAALLVITQYASIAKIAVIRSLISGKTIPLHLTLLGQGVFNNPPSVALQALNRALDIVRGYRVCVYVHVFTKRGEDLVKQLNRPLTYMSRDTFKTATLSHCDTHSPTHVKTSHSGDQTVRFIKD